jgi:hypothetical protein
MTDRQAVQEKPVHPWDLGQLVRGARTITVADRGGSGANTRRRRGVIRNTSTGPGGAFFSPGTRLKCLLKLPPTYGFKSCIHRRARHAHWIVWFRCTLVVTSVLCCPGERLWLWSAVRLTFKWETWQNRLHATTPSPSVSRCRAPFCLGLRTPLLHSKPSKEGVVAFGRVSCGGSLSGSLTENTSGGLGRRALNWQRK